MITAVILTKNNEKTIGNTLESLVWCDERILVDDGSSDKTCEIGRRRKAKIFTRPLSHDFASQRNFGLSKAKGDWVLFVDSDELITAPLREEILSVMRSGSLQDKPLPVTAVNGYFIRRKDIMWGRGLLHGETAHVRLLRLGRKGKGVWKRPIHEVWDIKGPTGVLKKPMFHFPHPDVAQFLSDVDSYSTINAAYMYIAGVRVSYWQIAAYPAGKFFVNYILRLGFLDGVPGIIVALMMSFHSFLTRGKIWELQKKVNSS